MAAIALTHGPSARAEQPAYVAMFNGVDLTGWEGQPGWWSVRDGVLFAESTAEKPCARSHYLYWKGGEPADFDLRYSFRISAEGNSGIQFRSERRPEWDTWGYQADMDGAGVYMGCLYQHERGLVAERGQKVRINESGEKAIETFADKAELLRSVRPLEWNTARIVASGPRVSIWINGVLMCEVEDHQPRLGLRKGIIALQMHQGPPMKVEYRDMKIRVDRS
ncbi:MAG: DUF1080 domain-containing protein [Planctomycetes bacterium]|nr:DUF1080 domain-containing protein [Planctomycetota bacterium]